MAQINNKDVQLNTIKVLVADDEKPARELLIKLLSEFQDIRVVGEAATGKEAVRLTDILKPNVVFLDINMPVITGVEAAKNILKLQNPPLIIFVTAYNEYAVTAFELDAYDYVVKPVQKERLEMTVNKIRESFKSPDRWQEMLKDMVKRLSPGEKSTQHIAVLDKEKGIRKVIKLSDALYFTAKDDKCFACISSGIFEISYSLTQLTSLLPEELFVRTHKSFIVNVKHIKEVAPLFHGAFTITMKNGEEIPLSRNYTSEFRQKVSWF